MAAHHDVEQQHVSRRPRGPRRPSRGPAARPVRRCPRCRRSPNPKLSRLHRRRLPMKPMTSSKRTRSFEAVGGATNRKAPSGHDTQEKLESDPFLGDKRSSDQILRIWVPRTHPESCSAGKLAERSNSGESESVTHRVPDRLPEAVYLSVAARLAPSSPSISRRRTGEPRGLYLPTCHRAATRFPVYLLPRHTHPGRASLASGRASGSPGIVSFRPPSILSPSDTWCALRPELHAAELPFVPPFS